MTHHPNRLRTRSEIARSVAAQEARTHLRLGVSRPAPPPPRRRSSRRMRAGVGLTAGLLALAVPLASRASAAEAPPFSAPETFLVSADAAGTQLPGTASNPIVAAEGRFVAFTSTTGTGAGAVSTAMVKDLLTGKVEPVSVNAKGATVGGTVAGISADGTKVAFVSSAMSLDATPNDLTDLYVRDRVTKATIRVDVDTKGVPRPVAPAIDGAATLSDDGSTVAWQSGGHILARTLPNGDVRTVDLVPDGPAGNGPAFFPQISANGQIVVFESNATNLSAVDADTRSDVYRRDLATGSLALISTNANGFHADDSSSRPSISGDGSTIAFTSNATNLVSDDTNHQPDVFVRTVGVNALERISVAAGGQQANNSSGAAAISGDGRFVAFHSLASNLVSGDSNETLDVFTRDRTEKRTIRSSMSSDIAPHFAPTSPNFAGSIDDSGSVVAFTSADTGLIGPGTKGPGPQAFVRWQLPMGPHHDPFDLAVGLINDFGLSEATGNQLAHGMESGTMNSAQAVLRAAHAKPFATDREPVTRLFYAFFKRSPDKGGLEFWRNRHAKGTTLAKIAAEFAKSNEFKTKYGSVGNAAFVKLVFRNVLEREPDAAGLAFWTKKLDAGTSRGDVMTAFSESSEGKRHLAPAVDSVLVVIGMLDRLPDAREFSELRIRAAQESSEAMALLVLESDFYISRYTPT